MPGTGSTVPSSPICTSFSLTDSRGDLADEGPHAGTSESSAINIVRKTEGTMQSYYTRSLRTCTRGLKHVRRMREYESQRLARCSFYASTLGEPPNLSSQKKETRRIWRVSGVDNGYCPCHRAPFSRSPRAFYSWVRALPVTSTDNGPA